MNTAEQPSPEKSVKHREAHQGDPKKYHELVGRTAQARFGPAFWGLFDEHLSPPDDATFVDLGTGTAALLEMLRSRYAQARLVGVEIEPRMLESARAGQGRWNTEIVESDLALPLPLSDGMADVVTLIMTFHELLYPPHVLKEARRILKPGGSLVLYDWVKRPLGDYLSSMERPLSADSLQHFREHCLFSADDLRYLVKDAGFEVSELAARRGGNFAMVIAKASAD